MSLLEQLDSKLRLKCSPQERAEILGEKACYLARAGSHRLADEIILTMRNEWGGGSEPRAMVWIMLAEGLNFYFSGSSEKAWDRVRRAWQISVAYRMLRLRPLTSAWMAHLEFHRSRYGEMRDYLADAFAANFQSHRDAHLRVALVVADGALYCGKHDQSRHWHSVAHALAVQSGDRLALAALMYNRAVHGLNCFLLNGIITNEKPARAELQRFALELESARQFESILGAATFWQRLDLMQGMYLLATDDLASAVAVFRSLRQQNESSSLSQLLHAYAAVCDVRCGDQRSAKNSVDRVLAGTLQGLDADELVLATSAYREVLLALGQWKDLSAIDLLLEAAKAKYVASRLEIEVAMEGFLDIGGEIGG